MRSHQRRSGSTAKAAVPLPVPALAGGDAMHSVRNRLAGFRVRKTVNVHLHGPALRAPFAPPVTEIPDDFLLFRVSRHHRLAHPQERRHTAGDAPEPRVPVRMLPPLHRLPVRLQAVAEPVRQAVHRALAGLVAAVPQLPGRRGRAAAGPAQRALRSAAGRRLQQALKGFGQFRIQVRQPLAPAAGPPLARGRPFLLVLTPRGAA